MTNLFVGYFAEALGVDSDGETGRQHPDAADGEQINVSPGENWTRYIYTGASCSGAGA